MNVAFVEFETISVPSGERYFKSGFIDVCLEGNAQHISKNVEIVLRDVFACGKIINIKTFTVVK